MRYHGRKLTPKPRIWVGDSATLANHGKSTFERKTTRRRQIPDGKRGRPRNTHGTIYENRTVSLVECPVHKRVGRCSNLEQRLIGSVAEREMEGNEFFASGQGFAELARTTQQMGDPGSVQRTLVLGRGSGSHVDAWRHQIHVGRLHECCGSRGLVLGGGQPLLKETVGAQFRPGL